MPESRKRKKNGHVVEADDMNITNWTDGIPMSPRWYAPLFVTLLLVGLIWLVIYYMSGGQYPIPKIGNWNLGIGVVVMLVGFLMTLRWR